MKTLFISTLFVFNFLLLVGQSIPTGTYIGYEKNPFCYNNNCKTIHDTINAEIKEGWYYKVTMDVRDSIMTMEKIPIYFPKTKDSIPYCDSSAFNGYYFYNVIENSYSANMLSASLEFCKYCRRCGTNTCRYVYVRYWFRKSGLNLYMDNFSEKNILFEKM